MKITDFIDRAQATKYFILDSHDKGDVGQLGHSFADEDFVAYKYEPSQNNKLIVGSVFLYRKPNKKGDGFQLIGGGVVRKIDPIDASGYKTAYISHGFKFIDPLKKGDPYLESFSWEEKSKLTHGWRGFWTNYGILNITENDFWGLVNGREVFPGIPNSLILSNEIADKEEINELSEDKYKKGGKKKTAELAPRNKKEAVIGRTGKVFPRDREIAKNALEWAKFKCEIDNSHTTFLRKKSLVPYCEPHHLIPICYQDSFEYSLDIEANIICLCSNCHNEIHYGANAKELITRLYNDRKEQLEKAGVKIDLSTLLAFYGIK